MRRAHAALLIAATALMAGTAAVAQTAASAPAVDESRIPDWIKRQAASPYKVVVESAPVRVKRERPLEDAAKTKAVAVSKPAVTRGAAAKTGVLPDDEGTARTAAASSSDIDRTRTAPPAVASTASPSEVTLPTPAPIAEPLTTPSQHVRTAAIAPTLAASPTAPPALPTPSRAELTVVKRVVPKLPASTLDTLSGVAKVVVAFTVNPDGTVDRPTITSSTHIQLNRPSLSAISGWRFEPIAEARSHMVEFAFTAE